MRHYVSLHSEERMGYPFEQSDPFGVVTRKPVARLIGVKVWSVIGSGQPRSYSLGSWFIVDEVGEADRDGFSRYVGGRVGHVFRPPIPLDHLPWFAEFRASQNKFSLGLQPIREEFAAALEALAAPPADSPYPDEVALSGGLVEGAVRQVTVNAYERNPKARRQCLEAHGCRCSACGLDFGSVYGLEFAGFIHVHHLRPLSEVGSEYVVDPVQDLRPVCPNCHAVIHHGGRVRSIEEVRQLLGGRRHPEQAILRTPPDIEALSVMACLPGGQVN